MDEASHDSFSEATLRYLSGHSVERVDVRSTAEQAFPQDEREHDPNARDVIIQRLE